MSGQQDSKSIQVLIEEKEKELANLKLEAAKLQEVEANAGQVPAPEEWNTSESNGVAVMCTEETPMPVAPKRTSSKEKVINAMKAVFGQAEADTEQPMGRQRATSEDSSSSKGSFDKIIDKLISTGFLAPAGDQKPVEKVAISNSNMVFGNYALIRAS